MAFRRDSDRAYRWVRWFRDREAVIRAAGLPADTVASQRAFAYLLLHGYNEAGWAKEAPWFEPDTLTAEQRRSLRELITDYVRDFWPEPRSKGWRFPLSWLWESAAERGIAPDRRLPS